MPYAIADMFRNRLSRLFDFDWNRGKLFRALILLEKIKPKKKCRTKSLIEVSFNFHNLLRLNFIYIYVFTRNIIYLKFLERVFTVKWKFFSKNKNWT